MTPGMISALIVAAALAAQPDSVAPAPGSSVPLRPSSAKANVAFMLSVPGVYSLTVEARGVPPTAGWSDVRLVRRPAAMSRPPDPGVLDLDLVGSPPRGIAASVVTPVSATYRASELEPAPTLGRLRVVRVHGPGGNFVEAKVH